MLTHRLTSFFGLAALPGGKNLGVFFSRLLQDAGVGVRAVEEAVHQTVAVDVGGELWAARSMCNGGVKLVIHGDPSGNRSRRLFWRWKACSAASKRDKVGRSIGSAALAMASLSRIRHISYTSRTSSGPKLTTTRRRLASCGGGLRFRCDGLLQLTTP